MFTLLRRALIVLACIAVVYLFVSKSEEGDGTENGGEKPDAVYAPEELKSMLGETVKKKWDAKQKKDWLTVYEMSHPKLKAKCDLVTFLQDKNIYYFENFKLLDLRVEGDQGEADIHYDWGVTLPMQIDLGEPRRNGVEETEKYEFDSALGQWFEREETEPKF